MKGLNYDLLTDMTERLIDEAVERMATDETPSGKARTVARVIGIYKMWECLCESLQEDAVDSDRLETDRLRLNPMGKLTWRAARLARDRVSLMEWRHPGDEPERHLAR